MDGAAALFSTPFSQQPDTDFPSCIVSERNTSPFQRFLNLQDGREVSLHDSIALLNSLEGR
jgi:hypothetical protein